MQPFSIFIVFALLFAFFVGGDPIPVEAQPQELPDVSIFYHHHHHLNSVF